VALDGGDLFGQRTQSEKDQTSFLCKETAALGYKVFGVGEMDLNYGLDYLRETEKTYGFLFVNANVRQTAGGPLLFPPYTVIEQEGLRIGVISVLSPAMKITSMSATPDQFVVDSPRDALDKYLPELRKKSDVVVLLAHLSSTETRELLVGMGDKDGNNPLIDICVEGQDIRQYRRLNKIGSVALLAANNQGKYVGQLDMTVDKKSHQIQFGEEPVTIYELDEKSPETTAVRDRVTSFEAEAAKKAKEIPPDTHSRPLGSTSEKFLGASACAKCHSQDYQTYASSAHARAWQTLVEKGQESNSDCVGCHVVGYNHVNGYDRGDSQSGRNSLYNVQCEACHGYGTQHVRDGQWVAAAKSSCTTCHTAENSPNFEYASYWAKIKH
jgi:hypothetical protein